MPSWDLGALDFHLPASIAYGWGRVAEVSQWAKPFGHRVLIVTMPDLPHSELVADRMLAAGYEITLYDQCEPEPSIEGIDAAWEDLSQEEYDLLLGVGGGSAMDTAKAFAVLEKGGGSAWEYTVEAGADRRPVPTGLLPILAVPTTAGTGSEVTYNAVLTNRALAKKAPIRSVEICPKVALIDPQLTVSMPPLLTASTGFDAFTHAYERYFGNKVLSPYIHQLAFNAMQMVVDNLELAVNEPENRYARMALSWAATQGGMVVVAQGGEAALHVFGLPIGAVAHIPHGQALAVMAGPLTRYHVRADPRRGREFGSLFGIEREDLAAEELVDAVEGALVQWLQRVGLPTTLSAHGVGVDRIEELLDGISLARVGNVFGSGFSPEDIRQVYLQAL